MGRNDSRRLAAYPPGPGFRTAFREERFLDKRRDKRVKRRVTCTLDIDGRHQYGAILNLAPGGLFVQTRAKPPRSDELQVPVHLRLPDAPDILVLETRIVRWYQVPSQLATVAGGGLGLTIQSAPDVWFEFVEAKKLVPVD